MTKKKSEYLVRVEDALNQLLDRDERDDLIDYVMVCLKRSFQNGIAWGKKQRRS